MTAMKRAIALGFFDGVHIGHAALVNKTKQRADEKGMKASVLTFDVHPDNLVFGIQQELINSPEGRRDILKREFGIEDVLFIHFNHTMMCMDWRDFIDSLVSELNVGWIVVGHDFRFGYKGQGNAERLREYCDEKGIGLDVIPAVTLEGDIVSSTRIRACLKEGKIEEANRLLGHPHFMVDSIHSGYHLGTQLGTPTINMFFPRDVLVLRFGVYATKVTIEGMGSYLAVTNVGVRPTVSDCDKVSVESFILDFAGNVYGMQARVEFFSFLRPEVKFSDPKALAEQINRDSENARSFFKEHPEL